MELNMLIGLVEEMRKKQKEFSQTRNIIVYQQVKTLEKEVDAAILHFKRDARNAGEQQEMFSVVAKNTTTENGRTSKLIIHNS